MGSALVSWSILDYPESSPQELRGFFLHVVVNALNRSIETLICSVQEESVSFPPPLIYRLLYFSFPPSPESTHQHADAWPESWDRARLPNRLSSLQMPSRRYLIGARSPSKQESVPVVFHFSTHSKRSDHAAVLISRLDRREVGDHRQLMR